MVVQCLAQHFFDSFSTLICRRQRFHRSAEGLKEPSPEPTTGQLKFLIPGVENTPLLLNKLKKYDYHYPRTKFIKRQMAWRSKGGKGNKSHEWHLCEASDGTQGTHPHKSANMGRDQRPHSFPGGTWRREPSLTSQTGKHWHTLKAKQLYHSLALNFIVGPLTLPHGTPTVADEMEIDDGGFDMAWDCMAGWKTGVKDRVYWSALHKSLA